MAQSDCLLKEIFMDGKNLKVLITGNLGFVGSATQKLFEERGIDVFGYDIMEKKDIRSIDQFDEVVRQQEPDRILHLAAIARFSDADRDPKTAHETNVLGTMNVASVAAKYRVPLVYSSTGSVYMPIKREGSITEDFETMGNSVYGVTKNLGELYIKSFGNPYIILRYAHLYGKEKRMHGLIGGFLERIERGMAPTLYGGSQSNSFTYIEDIAEANYLAVTAPWDKWNNIYNIGSKEEITAEDAGKLVCEIFGYKGEIEKVAARTVDPLRFWFNCNKAKIMLNFEAKYSLEQGLRHMAKEMGHEPVLDGDMFPNAFIDRERILVDQKDVFVDKEGV